MAYDLDFSAAEAAFISALDIDPSLALVHSRYALLLAATGRVTPAIEHARQALESAATSSTAWSDLAAPLVVAGQLAEAEVALRESIALDPMNIDSLMLAGFTLETQRNEVEAYGFYHHALLASGHTGAGLERIEDAFATEGLRAMHAAWLEELVPNDASVPAFALGFMAARAGRADSALEYLERPVRLREPSSIWIAAHPAFSELADSDAYRRLVEAAGLADFFPQADLLGAAGL